MITFVTDCDSKALADLAGVKWRAPTKECKVTFGTFQGALVGVESCGKLWAVHVDDRKAAGALVSLLSEHKVYGAEVWREATGIEVPRIAGGEIEETIDGAAAVAVDREGKATPIAKETAATAIAAARTKP